LIHFVNGSIVDQDALTATPNVFTFSSGSASTKLFKSFYFSGSASGTFQISLNVSGSSASEYQRPDSFFLDVITSSDPAPAPSVDSFIFDDSGSNVWLGFDQATDQAGLTLSTWSCNKLLVFVSSSLCTCSWVNSSFIKIGFLSLSSRNLLIPGSQVKLIGNRVRAFCGEDDASLCNDDIATSEQNLTLSTAKNPVVPKVIVTVPSKRSACDDLTIDASSSYGNGGRTWNRIIWTVMDSTGQTNTNITSYLNSAGSISQPITVPQASLSLGNITFILELQNFLGSRSASSVVVEILGDTNIPYVVIYGSRNLTTKVSSTLSISGYGSLASCADNSVTISYVWTIATVNGVTLSDKSSSLDARKFLLSGYSLSVGKTYIVKLVATSLSKNLATLGSSSALVYVEVISGSILASISGNSRLYYSNVFDI
jgi:hypothetical protein